MNIPFFNQKKHRTPVYSSEHVSWGERIGEDAYVGWVMVVSVSFIITLSLVIYAARLFFLVDSGGIVAPEAAVSSTHHAAFDPSALENLVGQFTQRAAASSALDHGYAGPADPSI